LVRTAHSHINGDVLAIQLRTTAAATFCAAIAIQANGHGTTTFALLAKNVACWCSRTGLKRAEYMHLSAADWTITTMGLNLIQRCK
jgi:hypothetical protein